MINKIVIYNNFSSPNNSNSKASKNINFGNLHITLNEANLGNEILSDIVVPFNRTLLPEILKTREAEAKRIIKRAGVGKIATPRDLVDKVNFFVLAAGEGSRFRPIARTVGEAKGREFNKISLPFHVDGNPDIGSVHVLDFATLMGKHAIEETGVKTIFLEGKSGSLGYVVKYYLSGNEIKDTIVCCGDNVFDEKASNLMEFFVRSINNPNRHMSLVGVAKLPEETAGKFAVLTPGERLGKDTVSLAGIVEKPSLEEAQRLACKQKDIANTGLFYISKEAMEKLIDEIKSGVNHISKNEKEPYDFALACRYIFLKIPDWFGIDAKTGADIKLVKRWEDIGEPAGLYNWIRGITKGHYLANFPPNIADAIRASFDSRAIFQGNKLMAFSFQKKPPTKIDGVEIFA